MDDLEFHPLTPDRWTDLEALFGSRGAYGGCWCMWWRLSRKEFEANQGEDNRKSLKEMVYSGVIPGILAYQVGAPIGWCSIAPREQYGALERSRMLQRLDEQPVWSLVCFYIHKKYQRQGVAQALVEAAIDYVRHQGGTIIEAYPTQPRQEVLPPVSSFMGVPSMFAKAGFIEVARPSPSRVIMRYQIEAGK